jgi:hypothetical protein
VILRPLVAIAALTSPAAADYARAGLYEVGGSAGIDTDVRNVSVAASLGWFVADNLELTGIASITVAARRPTLSSLIEPSYHLPVNRSLFGFFGMGIGYAYITGLGGGLAIAPRVGANVLVGRSVLTPSLSYENAAIAEPMMVRSSTSVLRFNLGYTATW